MNTEQTSKNIFTYIKSIPGKIYGNSGMVHFADINQAPPPYSMLQDIGRVATPKLVPRNCLRYLQTILFANNNVAGYWKSSNT